MIWSCSTRRNGPRREKGIYAEKSARQRLRDRRVSGISGGTPVSCVWWQHMGGREGAEVGKVGYKARF